MSNLDSWTVDLLGKDVYHNGVKVLPRIKGLNFVGDGVSSVDVDEVNGYVTVTVTGGAGSILFPELEVLTARSAVLTDVNYTLSINNASPINFTIDPDSTTNFPNGSRLFLFQKGAGQVTVVQGSGVTIRSKETLKLRGQYATGELRKLAANYWVLSADYQLT